MIPRAQDLPRKPQPKARRHARALAAFALCLCTSVAHAVDGQNFGSWSSKCEDKHGENESGCYIFQNRALREGGQRVLRIVVGYVATTSEPIALLSLPLGITLPPGVSLSIDGGEPTRIPVERCDPNGCNAGLKLEDKLLKQILAGKQMTVTFFDPKRQPIAVPLTLEGFDQGLQALRKPSK